MMCGIAPIMVSMKQRGFYILTVYPFLGIILGLIILPLVKIKLEKWESNKRLKKNFTRFTALFVIASVIMSMVQFGTIRRDKNEVQDCKMVVEYIGPNTAIDICHSQYGNWSKHGYYSRYGNITLERKDEKKHSYYLINNGECMPDSDLYEEVPLKLSIHKLYKKK